MILFFSLFLNWIAMENDSNISLQLKLGICCHQGAQRKWIFFRVCVSGCDATTPSRFSDHLGRGLTLATCALRAMTEKD